MTENSSHNKITYWNAKAGDTLTGIIQGNGAFNDLLYDEHKTLLLQDDSGSVVGIVLNRYLQHSLKQHNAALGDELTVIFHGKEQKNNGRFFNRYSVLVKAAV